MKQRRIWLLYLFQLTFIGIFALVLLGYRFQTGRNSFFENEMFSENVKGLQMSGFQYAEDVHFTLPEMEGLQYTVSRYLSGSEQETVRGVYGTADVFGFGSLIGSGRYFTAADFRAAEKTAVIGSSIAQSPACTEHGGRRYYIYENAEYEVIGEFAPQGNAADRAVFLNLPALDAQIGQLGGVYYVDAGSAETVRTVIAEIRREIGGAFTVTDMEFVPKTSRELNRLFRSMFLFCGLSALLCLIITTVFLIEGQRYGTAVRKLCGMTVQEIFVYYGARMLAVTAAAFVLIAAVMHLLTAAQIPVFAGSAVRCGHYLGAGGILLLISLCNTVCITRQCSAVDISSVLKGM